MCLKFVDNHHTKDSGVGYKVFKKTNFSFRFTAAVAEVKYFRFIWYKAKEVSNKKLATSSEYSKGFHIFEQEADAKEYFRNNVLINKDRWTIRKVEYKEVICSGQQNIAGLFDNNKYVPTIVANKMRIL
jgi:hypothetical protein